MSFFKQFGTASTPRLDQTVDYENGHRNANARNYDQQNDAFDDDSFADSHVTRPRAGGRFDNEYQRHSPANGQNSRVAVEADFSGEFQEPRPSQRQAVPPPNRARPQRITPAYYNSQPNIQENNAGKKTIFETANFRTNGFRQNGTSNARSTYGTKPKPTPWDIDDNEVPDIVPTSRRPATTRDPFSMNTLKGALRDSDPNIFDDANGTDDWGDEWGDVKAAQQTQQRSGPPTEQRNRYNDFGDDVDNRGSRTGAASSNRPNDKTATGSNAIPLGGQATGFRHAMTGARNKEGDKKARREKYMPSAPNETDLFEDPTYRIEKGDQIEKIANEIAINGGDGKGEKIGVNRFEQMGLSQEILNNLHLKKITEPMPIQKYVIPLVLKNQPYPIIGNAETGSGKTIAFLTPIICTIQQIKKKERNNRGTPYALIIEPTRELAYQLYLDARAYAAQTGVTVEVIYGEMPVPQNRKAVEKGVDILVCTLGRLVHFLNEKIVSLDKLKFLVLDEADKLLKGDNVEHIEKIKNLPNIRDHRTLLFSATYDEDLQQFLSESHLIDQEAYFISVGSMNCVAKTIDQRFVEVHRHDKHEILLQLLRDADSTKRMPCKSLTDGEDDFTYKPEKTIVFVNHKRTSDMVAMELAQKGFTVISLNADRTPQQRWDAINKFQRGMYDVLVATDVAARGLNIPKVDHVINFDLPKNDVMQYNHRIGRTGRAGNVGHATSFFDTSSTGAFDSDVANVEHYVKCLRQVNQEVPDFMKEIARLRGIDEFETDHLGVRDTRSSYWQ